MQQACSQYPHCGFWHIFCSESPFFLVASPPLRVASAVLGLAAVALHSPEPGLWLFLSVKIETKLEVSRKQGMTDRHPTIPPEILK